MATPKPKQPGIKRSLADRYEAALAYVLTGSDYEASAMCGIPRETLQDWRGEDWWPEMVAKAQEQKQRELDGRFTGIIHKAAKEIMDRLENGDEVVAKDGTMVKRKVGAKDLALISGLLTDKRDRQRGSMRPPANTKEALKDKKQELEDLGKAPIESTPLVDKKELH